MSELANNKRKGAYDEDSIDLKPEEEKKEAHQDFLVSRYISQIKTS